MEPVIYHRTLDFDKYELESAKKYFKTTNLLTNIEPNHLVIPRYSVFPFYYHQQMEIENIGSKLINTYGDYCYIADLQNYIYDLKELTPTTWRNIHDIPEQYHDKPFVLKGQTNSKKNSWLTSMFANNIEEAKKVYGNLANDSLISEQNIYIREYVPMMKFMDGVNGMPVTNEYRIFVAFDKVVSSGYYWSNYLMDLAEIDIFPNRNQIPMDLVNEVIKRVNKQSNFYTIDVGQKENGDWFVVEMNDGGHSGLSDNDPDEFYKNLRAIVDGI